MQIAIVDEELPYPANSGKRIRTLNLLTRLAGRRRVVVITHRYLEAADLRTPVCRRRWLQPRAA